jgi:hypothetical protein
MLFFPVLAVAVALIVIGRGGDNQFFEERRRDRIARTVLLWLGILILLGWVFL